MDDGYSVQTTAAEASETGGLDTLQALKDADTFLVADAWGDLKDGADGLFHQDTRILSRLVMTAGLARPSRLSSGVSRDNVFFTAHTTNRPLPPMGGRSSPPGREPATARRTPPGCQGPAASRMRRTITGSVAIPSTPLTMNWIPMHTSRNPITFVSAFIPVCPISATIDPDTRNVA